MILQEHEILINSLTRAPMGTRKGNRGPQNPNHLAIQDLCKPEGWTQEPWILVKSWFSWSSYWRVCHIDMPITQWYILHPESIDNIYHYKETSKKTLKFKSDFEFRCHLFLVFIIQVSQCVQWIIWWLTVCLQRIRIHNLVAQISMQKQ